MASRVDALPADTRIREDKRAKLPALYRNTECKCRLVLRDTSGALAVSGIFCTTPDQASVLVIIGSEQMKRVDLYIKVTVEVDEDEKPERIAGEICRQMEKLYGVRSAELSNIVSRD
jgi:hypothetical protein